MGDVKEVGAGESSVNKGEIDYVKWFSEVGKDDIKFVGGKGANLGEMYSAKFPIPPGFVVSAQSYRKFVEANGIDVKIKETLEGLDVEDTGSLNDASRKVRALIESGEIPEDMKEEILESYEILDDNKVNSGRVGGVAADILRTAHERPFVAVRSSATAEDLADASFAGQQESFLNVKGDKDLLEKVRKCFSSLFTPRAIYYRTKKGFDHNEANLAVVVQKMVDSDKSGVMFSVNPVGSGKLKDSVLIEAVFGLGEGIVSGRIKPDSFAISGNMEEFEILDEKLAYKKSAIVRDSSGANKTVTLTEDKGKQRTLDNYQLKMLAQYAKQLEEHYEKPQDIEFAIEGNEIYIVQSRPMTTKVSESGGEDQVEGEVLLSGLGASPGVSSGKVKIIHNLEELEKVGKGDVLVTEMTNPDMVVAMQRASGIVTDEGGITSHAAIVSREMGIPAVVGTGDATSKLKDEQEITVDGNHGKVINGKGETKLVEIHEVVPTKTKIKVIVDLPDFAERAALSKAKAVGLTRLEGIIASCGKHPKYFVDNKNMEGYVEVLVNGLKKIADPFDEIWIRSSDIRSDEYRNLEGAPKEVEGNPMLGDHGIRFSLKHEEIMKAEFMAVKEVADHFEGKKIGLMAPQIISVDEVKKMKAIANEVGMPENVRVGIMVETPAAVQIINDLCNEGIDFVSFGTNDLTQYTLAIDRNNPDVQEIYDAMNPAVLSSIGYVIRRCKKYGVETSICGQAGSDPEMAKFLVESGIDSISVNADAARKVSEVVSQAEKQVAGAIEEGIKEVETGQEERVMPGSEVINEDDRVEVEGEKQGTPAVAVSNSLVGGDSGDMEDAVLEALEGDAKDEYNPGIGNGNSEEKSRIPDLNEAIPVNSEMVEKAVDARREEVSEVMPGSEVIRGEDVAENIGEESYGEENEHVIQESSGDSSEGEADEGKGDEKVLDIF